VELRPVLEDCTISPVCDELLGELRHPESYRETERARQRETKTKLDRQ
jgi:hypothetical protein